MDLSYKQEVGVGVFVLLGLLVFGAGMMWLTGRSVTGRGFMVEAVFSDVGSVKGGEPVMVSGVRIGRVANVLLERPGKVVLTLEIRRQERPHTDARAWVKQLNFFGDAYVDYFPGTAESLMEAGRPIQGQRDVPLTERAAGAAARASDLLANAQVIFSQQMAQDLHNTMVAVQRSLNTLAEASHGPAVQQATHTLSVTETLMRRIDSLVTSPTFTATGRRVDTLTANLTLLTNHLSQATRSMQGLLAQVDSGRGTLGRLATDTLLYNNLNATLESLRKLLEDLRERPGRYLTVKVF